MKYSVSLKQNKDFRRLYHRGKYAACATLVLYWSPNRYENNRLGITVSTKLGNAVVRNRTRRRIREIYRLHEEELRRGMDLVIVGRSSAPAAEYRRLDRDFQRLVKRLGLTAEGKERSEA
ncbi:MAG: ribonuclease P protein component [Clostridiales bacterium]|nr:ribonuclease P protein component [Clostridiales bacterium]